MKTQKHLRQYLVEFFLKEKSFWQTLLRKERTFRARSRLRDNSEKLGVVPEKTGSSRSIWCDKGTWLWKVRVSFFAIYIYTFQRDTQCCSTDCLLMHRCQLHMFRTVTVHPQELLFRCCMCRLWYVVRNALPDTSRWYNDWGRTQTLYQRDVSDSAVLTTYHSLHIQQLKRSSWGWTVTVRNM